MLHLNLTLLGAFQAQLDNQPLTTFHSAKVQGLLAYLALEATLPHACESLTALFGDPKTQLLSYLRARRLLLILDNCKHLLDGVDLVADLLGAAPQVKVLATSREPLSLHEEWLHPLTGMSFSRTGENMEGVHVPLEPDTL